MFAFDWRIIIVGHILKRITHLLCILRFNISGPTGRVVSPLYGLYIGLCGPKGCGFQPFLVINGLGSWLGP